MFWLHTTRRRIGRARRPTKRAREQGGTFTVSAPVLQSSEWELDEQHAVATILAAEKPTRNLVPDTPRRTVRGPRSRSESTWFSPASHLAVVLYSLCCVLCALCCLLCALHALCALCCLLCALCALCALCSVLYSLRCLLCAVFSALSALCCILCALCSALYCAVLSVLYSLRCLLYAVFSVLCAVFSAVSTLRCLLCAGPIHRGPTCTTFLSLVVGRKHTPQARTLSPPLPDVSH